MAIWQHTLFLIPIENFEENFLEFSRQETTKYLKDTKCFWENFSLQSNLIIEKIDINIPNFKNEDSNYIYWKGDTGNFLDNDCGISFINRKISSFQIRFDLRTEENIKNFISFLLDIANSNSLKFMNVKYEHFGAEKELLVNDILTSNGMRFLKNPEKFLDNI